MTYKEFDRIAKAAYGMKAIKSPTVTALAKAALFTQANLFLGVEQKNNRIKEYDEKMRQLQNRHFTPYVQPQ